MRHRFPRRLVRFLFRWSVYGCLLILALLLIVAVASRNMRRLEPWHTTILADYSYDSSISNFTEYQALEDHLIDSVATIEIPPDKLAGRSRFVRYIQGGVQNPAQDEQNWNRSYELIPETIRGGALLIHGLSDSPYSLRTVAEQLHSQGFYVLGLRLPGHGTIPSGLLDTRWQDWAAAVELATTHVQTKLSPDLPFLMVGYSCGGALAVSQTTKSILGISATPPADGLILFSPAIGITPIAAASNWHKLFTWIPGFEKNAWMGVSLEVDPYKYVSFTKNAGAQMFYLTRHVQKLLSRLEDEQSASRFPPTLTFQSLVDSTIKGEAIVTELYQRLHASKHRLVVFDVNHAAGFEGLLADHPRRQLQQLIEYQNRAFTLEVITNKSPGSNQVVRMTYRPGASEPHLQSTDLLWPAHLFSLSHIAIPVPPDDPVYGHGDTQSPSGRLSLGALSPRGEIAVLSLDTALLLRLRYNPFYSLVQAEVAQFMKRPVE